MLKNVDVKLLIVGEFWKDKFCYLERIKKLSIEDNVRIIDKYVPNEEVNLYFAACDIAVLPYTSATGSGVVQLAFGCERPVVTTRVGSLSEVVIHGKTGYLIDPGDTQSIAESVIDYFSNSKEKEFVSNIKMFKENFSWQKMRENIEALADGK